MGVHKLEIELSDELMEKIDRLSLEQKSSRSEVIVSTLRNHLPTVDDASEASIARRLAALDRVFKLADSVRGEGRSQEDIDRQVREFRADRTYDR
jgi:predicted transcriptional regulator